MYNFDDNIPSKPVNSFLDVGIHEDLKLDRWEYKVSENGNKFFAMYLKSKQGEELSHTEWEPSDKEENVLKDKVHNQMTRFRYIIEALIPGKEFKFTATDFESFCSNVSKILDDNYEGKLVRVKVVYNNKNFTCLPRYINSTWIESMDIPKSESRIKVSSSDKMTKTERDNTLVGTTSSDDIFGESTDKKDALPNDNAPF